MKKFCKDKWWGLIVILLAWLPLYMGSWDKTKPAQNRPWDDAAGDMRDNFAVLESAIGAEHDFDAATQTGVHTTITATGSVTAQGSIAGGTDGVTQGKLILYDGAGGSLPAYIEFRAPAGESWFLFIEDDGTVKVHTVAPTANTDGDEIGGQS